MATLQREVRDFEPRGALVGLDADGLGHHRKIVEGAKALGAEFVALEIGATQTIAGATIVKDLAGLNRVAMLDLR